MKNKNQNQNKEQIEPANFIQFPLDFEIDEESNSICINLNDSQLIVCLKTYNKKSNGGK